MYGHLPVTGSDIFVCATASHQQLDQEHDVQHNDSDSDVEGYSKHS